MNSQNRFSIAIVLCMIVWVLWSQIFAPPVPIEGDAAATTAETTVDSDRSAAKTAALDAASDGLEAEGEMPAKPEPVREVAAAPVEVESHGLRTDLLELDVTNASPGAGGIIRGIHLLEARFAGHETARNAFGLDGAGTLSFRFADETTDFTIPDDAPYAVREASSSHVVLGYENDQVDVEGRIELLDGYEGRLRVRVHNRSGARQQHRLHVETRVGQSAEQSQYNARQGICRTSDDVELEDEDDVEDGAVVYDGPIRWGGVQTKYFATLVVPQEPVKRCDVLLAETGGFLVGRLVHERVSLAPGETRDYVFGLYIGAKELEQLGAFSAVSVESGELEHAIDWGSLGAVSEVLGRFMLRLLRWFHGLVDSWGLAIVCVTILIKLVTLPLTLKQMSSMMRMKEIQPEIEKIKTKYADDRVKQSQEMQALFSRSGANPLAGCLPMIIQLPIWFALYGMLGTAVELLHESFAWLPDLTKPDPYFVLPVVIGGVMVVQNRMMPSTGNEAQARMMRWIMPIMFGGFTLFLPSGLSLYMFVNVLLSVIQALTQSSLQKKRRAREASSQG